MFLLANFSPPTEGIKHQQPSTKFFVRRREIGCGTLYITESKLSWRNDATGEGFSLFYPKIAVHAVSRDIERFGSECMFILVDTGLDDTVMYDGEDSDDSGGDEREGSGEAMTEIRFVPDDKGQLDAMYQAMNICQFKRPAPQDSFSEDDEYLDADEEGDNTPANSGYIEDHAVWLLLLPELPHPRKFETTYPNLLLPRKELLLLPELPHPRKFETTCPNLLHPRKELILLPELPHPRKFETMCPNLQLPRKELILLPELPHPKKINWKTFLQMRTGYQRCRKRRARLHLLCHRRN